MNYEDPTKKTYLRNWGKIKTTPSRTFCFNGWQSTSQHINFCLTQKEGGALTPRQSKALVKIKIEEDGIMTWYLQVGY